MSEAVVRPYSIASEATGSSGNMSSLYPSTVLSPQTSHQTFRNSPNQLSSNLNSNQSRPLSSDTTGSPYAQNFPRPGITAQMRSITELDESVSGSEVLSPPAYDDVDYGPSPISNFSSRPLPVPRFKN